MRNWLDHLRAQPAQALWTALSMLAIVIASRF